MASIWDQPGAVEAPLTDTDIAPGTPFPGPSAPTVDPAKRVYGTEAGPLLAPAGRGIENGVPMGETAQERERALDEQYRFRPTWRGRLAAATRAALGR